MKTMIAFVLIIAGCAKRDVDVEADLGVTDSSDAGVYGKLPTARVSLSAVRQEVDLLFVVDNSGSMAEEQVNITKSFPRLIEALRAEWLGSDGTGQPCNKDDRSGCTIPNLHIGVVSTDLGAGPYTSLPSCEVVGGDKGKLQNSSRVAGCTPPTEPYISLEGRCFASPQPWGSEGLGRLPECNNSF